MNPKSQAMAAKTLAFKGFGEKLEARRQVSAPQISHQLPDEVREVYEKITKGQKVTLPPPLKKPYEKLDASPRLGLISRREAFKPASHFMEVRGYETAIPKQICVNILIFSLCHAWYIKSAYLRREWGTGIQVQLILNIA